MPVQIGQTEASFTNPLALLNDCHRRIERFLGILLRIAQRDSRAPLGGEERSALQTALDYFHDAAPNHTADEEESLFPRMVEHATTEHPMALALIAELEAGHEDADSAHQEIDRLGREWLRNGTLAASDAAHLLRLLRELESFYRRHIAAEDTELFPLAGRMLEPEELAEVGREMRARRRLD